MKAITVKQPWAWAIAHGGKTIENRSKNIAGGYRGPVAIHAGAGTRWSNQGAGDSRVMRAFRPHRLPLQVDRLIDPAEHHEHFTFGAIIAIADLADAHPHVIGADPQPTCCAPWGDPAVWHLVLTDVRQLPKPIPARGQLGLWTPPQGVLDALTAVTA